MRILWIDARHDNDKGLVRPTPVALGKVLFLIQWCAKIVSKKRQKVSKKCSKKCQKERPKERSKEHPKLHPTKHPTKHPKNCSKMKKCDEFFKAKAFSVNKVNKFVKWRKRPNN